MATTQAFALLGVTSMTALVMVISGHGVDLNSIHWNGSDIFRALFDVSDLSGWRFFQGALAAIPVIYLSKQVETSDRRDMSHVNFSTISTLLILMNIMIYERCVSLALSRCLRHGDDTLWPTVNTIIHLPHTLLEAIKPFMRKLRCFSHSFFDGYSNCHGRFRRNHFRGSIPTAVVHLHTPFLLLSLVKVFSSELVISLRQPLEEKTKSSVPCKPYQAHGMGWCICWQEVISCHASSRMHSTIHIYLWEPG
jgi:hypothetical protein